MRRLADPGRIAGMSRYGIGNGTSLGLSVPQLRGIAKRTGHNQDLAEDLWRTGIHEARILAALVGEASVITRSP